MAKPIVSLFLRSVGAIYFLEFRYLCTVLSIVVVVSSELQLFLLLVLLFVLFSTKCCFVQLNVLKMVEKRIAS